MTLVGNPVMHHLLLGINPVELGGAPFALATDQAAVLKASDIGLTLDPGTRVFVLPCIAGHVGADTAGVILAERPDLSDTLTVLVDVGTNAEIVLGNRHQLFACSSPTGPAFEGAQISCGQRAAPGAIERVRVDPATLEPRFKVIGSDLWSDDPGFAQATQAIGVTGLCGSGIIEALAEMFLAGIIRSDGTIDGALAERNPRVHQDGATFSYTLHEGEHLIRVIQTDVRAIQLAKAALYAGIRLLMDRMGVDAVEKIRLAGAFGSHIDVQIRVGAGHAARLRPGTMSARPAMPPARVPGSRCSTGACGARSSGWCGRVEKIETAVEPKFQAHFVDAMALPHQTAPYPNLSKVGWDAAGGRAGRRPTRPQRPAGAARTSEPTGRKPMSDQAPAHRASRGAGRDAKRAARLASAAQTVPFITRKIPFYEVLDDQALALIEHNADTVLEEIESISRKTRKRSRFGRMPAPMSRASAVRFPARPVPLAGPSLGPRANIPSMRATRRAACRSAARTRCSRRITARPSCATSMAAVATARSRISAIREADLCLALAAPFGRHGVRAGRSAGEQAAFRDGLCPYALQRQALYGLGHGAGAGAGHGRDVQDPVWRRLHGSADRDGRRR